MLVLGSPHILGGLGASSSSPSNVLPSCYQAFANRECRILKRLKKALDNIGRRDDLVIMHAVSKAAERDLASRLATLCGALPIPEVVSLVHLAFAPSVVLASWMLWVPPPEVRVMLCPRPCKSVSFSLSFFKFSASYFADPACTLTNVFPSLNSSPIFFL